MTHMGVKHMFLAPFPPRGSGWKICAMDINKALGAAVRHYRTKAKLTQQDFGFADNSGMSRFERGEQGVSTERLIAIAAKLDVKLSELWARAEFIAKHGIAAGSSSSDDLRLKANIQSLKAQSEAMTAMASFVEMVISTTPGAAKALRELLSQILMTRTSDDERDFVQRLISRVAASKARAPGKSAAARARESF
jgi:transcriptional regulator with XRE-family HTH domain